MKILAIETSCDETAVAILEVKRGIFSLLSNVVSSQVKTHAKYGGIVPEIAARMQIEMMMPVLEQAITEAGYGVSLKNINAIAFTQGPGLVTSLVVGVETAKTLAWTLNKPLVPVNHLVAHLLVNHLQNGKVNYPSLGLVVSGGHTMLVLEKTNQDTKSLVKHRMMQWVKRLIK
jgi:N6-L-threonylcarbamoyladenine synthase